MIHSSSFSWITIPYIPQLFIHFYVSMLFLLLYRLIYITIESVIGEGYRVARQEWNYCSLKNTNNLFDKMKKIYKKILLAIPWSWVTETLLHCIHFHKQGCPSNVSSKIIKMLYILKLFVYWANKPKHCTNSVVKYLSWFLPCLSSLTER